MSERTQHDTLITISEFRSGYPQVPFAPDVDVDGLTEDDPEPFFVTLPVAKVNAKSKSGWVYGAAANEQLAEQVNQRKPEGRLGHMKPEDRATRYDLPAVRWLGAQVVDGTTWVKGYVPKNRPDVREHFRLAMRSNAQAALSMYGRGSVNKHNEVVRLDLESIDIADPMRAGLPVGARPLITANMADDDTPPESDEDTIMSESNQIETLLQEMRSERDEANARLAEMQQTISELELRATLIAEMAEMLDVDEDNLKARITEMQTEIDAARAIERKQRVMGLIDGSADGAEKPLVALEEMRDVVIAHMGPEDTWPTDDEKIADAVNRIMDRPAVKTLSEMIVKAKGGPALALGTSGSGQRAQQTDEEIDAEADRKAREIGAI